MFDKLVIELLENTNNINDKNKKCNRFIKYSYHERGQRILACRISVRQMSPLMFSPPWRPCINDVTYMANTWRTYVIARGMWCIFVFFSLYNMIQNITSVINCLNLATKMRTQVRIGTGKTEKYNIIWEEREKKRGGFEPTIFGTQTFTATYVAIPL